MSSNTLLAFEFFVSEVSGAIHLRFSHLMNQDIKDGMEYVLPVTHTTAIFPAKRSNNVMI